jgi:hypothetical protein
VSWLVLGIAAEGFAGPKKSKKPPAPMNKGVSFEAYPGTDIAMISYKTSRQEFRVGHSPYQVVRFHVGEFILIAEHTRKYLRPDFKAEIKMAPNRSKPGLMANKTFQAKWKNQLKEYTKLLETFKKVKSPGPCKKAQQAYLASLQDEIRLSQAIAKRMFVSQQIRARELLREDLLSSFRSRNVDWYDRLFDDFEANADLEKFYPRFVDLFVEPGLKKAREAAETAMKKVGLEYATAAADDGDKGVLD